MHVTCVSGARDNNAVLCRSAWLAPFVLTVALVSLAFGSKLGAAVLAVWLGAAFLPPGQARCPLAFYRWSATQQPWLPLQACLTGLVACDTDIYEVSPPQFSAVCRTAFYD